MLVLVALLSWWSSLRSEADLDEVRLVTVPFDELESAERAWLDRYYWDLEPAEAERLQEVRLQRSEHFVERGLKCWQYLEVDWDYLL